MQCMATLSSPDFCKTFSPTVDTVGLCVKGPGPFNRHHPVLCLLSNVVAWNLELKLHSVAKKACELILGCASFNTLAKGIKTWISNCYRNDVNTSEICLLLYCLIFAVSLLAEKEDVMSLHVIKSLLFGKVPLEGWEIYSSHGLWRCVGFFFLSLY